ncbi:MAG: DUF839 domain-containing protein [Rhodothermales bacterium]|nr:DUF839 domain-containing protein [Rhodothermales bacterium]
MSSRRYFLRQAGAVSLGFAGLHRLFDPLLAAESRRYNPSLTPDPRQILDLPPGFSYQVISRAGDPMADGFVVPARPDGMAAFPGPGGLTILLRNHETALTPGEGAYGAGNARFSQIDPALVYDAGFGAKPSLGGTSTLVFDTRTQTVVREYLSLAGTQRNCAGGPTPWNSWITCEETVERAGDVNEKDHGYNFEVPASATPRLTPPVPLKAMGRFNHEAIAVDPASGVVYQTEDRHDGLIYRFIPTEPGRLDRGGRLQALVVVDQPSLDTRNWEEGGAPVQRNAPMAVRWIDLDNVEAPEDDLRTRGSAAGAARFARGEGMWYASGTVYFACTNGGREKKGQIWKYVPSPFEGTHREPEQPATLALFVEPNDGSIIENADNLTVAPWGDLVVCEDGPGSQHLLRITPAGDVIRFATNVASESELAGSVFSPDGSTLFVNVQTDGLTLAITGPWATLAV